MDRKGLSKEVLLDRYLDKREVRNIMGRITAHYSVREEGKIYDDFWSKRDDVCLGVNDGWFEGAEAVKSYYKGLNDRVVFETKLIQKAFPKRLAGMSDEEVFGAGMMTYRPMCTQVVEIAKDGKTAKGIWCDRGSHSQLTPGGPVAFWEWGWFAVDFVKEGDDWKIWHMQNFMELVAPCGESWGQKSGPKPVVDAFKAMADYKDPQPNVPVKLHEMYNPNRPFTTSPALPCPYETFSETFSYGI